MANLTPIASVTTGATALSNLILVSPQNTVGYQPQNIQSNNGSAQQQKQPPPIIFHYEGEQTSSLESDITDHYIEDNTAVQDQIALRPEVITTHGFVGELNDIAPALLKPLQQAAAKLVTIGAYTPSLSTTALIAYNEAAFAYALAANLVNSAVSTWSTITGGGGENFIGSNGLNTGAFNSQTGQISNNQTKQQVYYQQFYGYWRNKTLFTVQTPWAIFQNMAIKSLRAIQDAETNVITDFEVSFKMIRFVSTIQIQSATLYDNSAFQNRLQNQGADPVNLGTATPPQAPTSFGSNVSGVA